MSLDEIEVVASLNLRCARIPHRLIPPRNSVLPRPGGYDGALPARSSTTWSGGPTISARRVVVRAPRRSALDNRPPERQTGPAGDGRSDAEVDVDADRSKQEDKHAAGLEPATRGVDRPDQHGNQGQLDESEDCRERERQPQRSQGQHPHDHYPGDEEQPLGVHEGVQGDPEPVVQQSEDQESITEPESPEDAEYAGDGALADRSRPDRRDGQAKPGSGGDDGQRRADGAGRNIPGESERQGDRAGNEDRYPERGGIAGQEGVLRHAGRRGGRGRSGVEIKLPGC